MKIGDKVYTFDENRRVYPPGSGFPAPIYAEHFREEWIVGEAGRSWLINTRPDAKGLQTKVAKKPRFGRVLWTEEERDDAIWVHGHRHRIAAMLERQDAGIVRKVAELIGYKPA